MRENVSPWVVTGEQTPVGIGGKISFVQQMAVLSVLPSVRLFWLECRMENVSLVLPEPAR